jgi:hypothetical protein
MAWLPDTSSAAADGCAAPGFSPPTVYRAFGVSIVAADLDGDDDLDLVSTGIFGSPDFAYLHGMLSLFSGDDTGAFVNAGEGVSLGIDPRAIAAGDFDGDGLDDLVLANAAPSASVLLNKGNIRHARPLSLEWPSPQTEATSSVLVADFNADGKPDVVVTNVQGNAVSIALGDGAGNFTNLKTFSSGGASPAHAVAADFDGDGKLDLAVANRSDPGNNVAILAGDGAGNFGAPTVFAAGAAPSFLASGDFNADHKIDLAVVVNGGAQNIAILIGNGAGGFAAPSYVASGGKTPGNLVAVDFNGDDKTDIGVVNKQEGNVAILLGDGAGKFNFSISHRTGSTSPAPSFMIAPDLNDDGKPDLVIAHKGMTEGSDRVSVRLNECGMTTSRLSFSQLSYSAPEEKDRATLTVIRSGSLAGPLTVDYATFDATALNLYDYNETGGTLTFADGETSKTLAVEIVDDRVAEWDEVFLVGLLNPTEPAVLAAGGFAEVRISDTTSDPGVSISVDDVSVTEGEGRAVITVTRRSDASDFAFIDYRTLDSDARTVSCSDATGNRGGAYARCDFAATAGSLVFAPEETQKTFTIPITDDAHVEGTETFTVELWNPSIPNGFTTRRTVTIRDDDAAGAANPIFTTPFFVRQHYLDFLSREPEAGEPWSGVLNRCPNVNDDPACDRITVSQSFFRSPESLLKGFYVFRLYKLAFNRLPEYVEFIADMSFVTGATEAEVYRRKAQLASAFTMRDEFKKAYPLLSNKAFVERLLGRYQLTQITTPDPAQPDGAAKITLTRATLIDRLNINTLTRAQVLRAVADSDEAREREFDNAFVAMQYYGYLRRKPEPAGYAAWLEVLRRGDARTMINGFMNSTEYKLRFGGL